MNPTPARSIAEEERTKILGKVVAEYRRLCSSGFPRRARSRAIELKVPAKLRRQRNGDHNRWWDWLDRALRAPAATSPPPKELVPTPREHPTGREQKHYWWQDD